MDPKIKAIYASFLTGAKLTHILVQGLDTPIMTLDFVADRMPEHLYNIIREGVYRYDVSIGDDYRYIFHWRIWIVL